MVVNFDHAACNNRMRDPITCSFQESRPEDAVVVDDITANEMRNPVLPAPEPFPVISGFLCPFFGKSNIADGCIDPYVDNKVIPARELYAPFECSGYTPVVEFVLYPADRVVLCIAGSLQRIKVGKQEVLELREFEEVMFLIAEFGFCATDFADRVLDLTRLKVLATPLVALIPPGRLSAVGTCSLNIPVRKEAFTFCAECLVDNLLVECTRFYRVPLL
jgi:hypothetical protein